MLILDSMSMIDGRVLSSWRAMAGMSRVRERPARGLDALWHAAAGVVARRRRGTGGYVRRGRGVLELDGACRGMSDTELDERLGEARQGMTRRGGDERWALALVREAGRREMGLAAHAVQVSAASALLDGCVVELATGEGKTLVAALAGVVRAWRSGGVHVITANDYLAARDAQWMGPVFERAGLSVGVVTQETGLEERRAAYRRDVVYTTSKEVAADFLRDRLALGPTPTVGQTIVRGMRREEIREPILPGLQSAIVDEADAVLIDEAVTPLILSMDAGNAKLAEGALACAEFVGFLVRGRDFVVEEGERSVRLTGAGRRRVHEWDGGGCDLLASVRRREEMAVQALVARWLYERERHYIVEGEGGEARVVIIDERTGRLLPDRSWRHGMQQAIEAKEGIGITGEKETLARISFQRFFALYASLGGMTGTAREESGEFWRLYRLPVVRIPTNRPVIRRRMATIVARDRDAKHAAVIREIQSARQAGRAVLVGTRFVGESERLSERLREAGIEHAVLNAVRHRDEAAIIEDAGRKGRVTIATNMAGRGTDIVLEEAVREGGGLLVLCTERNPTARLDRQFFGRAGRQGDPGSCRFVLTADDPLLVGGWVWLCRALRGVGLAGLAFRGSQTMERARDRRRRSAVRRSDTWLEESTGFAGPEF